MLLKNQMRNKQLMPPRISKMKVSRIMSHVVSKVLLELRSFKDVLSGVDFWEELDNVVDNDAAETETEEVTEDGLGNDDENIDGGVSLNDKPSWMTKSNPINQTLFPILSRFGATISDVELSGLLTELVHFNRDIGRDMTFGYKNGREGLLLEVPQNISTKYKHFRQYSGRSKWLHKVLKHMGGETDDDSANEGAYLITRWLCNE